MILIQQGVPSLNSLGVLLPKHSEVVLNIDKDAVKSDIDTLKIKKSNSLSRVDKKNIDIVEKYLCSLLGRLDGGALNLSWKFSESTLSAYPIELRYIPEYSIEMVDYIDVSGSRLIRLDYNQVYQIMAIEMMYRDLGETLISMEDKLKDLGMVGVYPASKLLSLFDDNILKLSKVLKVGDSPYLVDGKNSIFDYFGRKQFNAVYYRDAVDYSMKIGQSIILEVLLQKWNRSASKSSNIKICSLSESGIYFITDGEQDIDTQELFNESVVIRVLGRRFEVKPKITVF